MTDDELIDGYVRSMRMRGLSERTVHRRSKSLRLFATEVGGLRTATVEDVEIFILARTAPATRRAYFSDIRQLYLWANRREHLDIDPTRKLDVPRVPKRQPRPLSDDQVSRLLQTIDPDSDPGVAVMLGLFAGLRVGDMANLHTDDLDFERRTILIRHGKGGKSAVLPMAEQLAEVLRNRPPGPVIAADNPRKARWQILKAYDRAGIVGRRAHDLRHTFGTRAAQATNGNLVAVAQLMRHSNYATSQGYIAWAPNTAPIVDQLYESAEIA